MALFQPDPWLEDFVEASHFSFEWDSGNRFKNWRRHGITSRECEEVFLNGALPVGNPGCTGYDRESLCSGWRDLGAKTAVCCVHPSRSPSTNKGTSYFRTADDPAGKRGL
jgi:hypothetical protein